MCLLSVAKHHLVIAGRSSIVRVVCRVVRVGEVLEVPVGLLNDDTLLGGQG